jgi:hypothetical protein
MNFFIVNPFIVRSSGARVETGRGPAIDAGEHADTRPADKEPSVRRLPLFARIGERFRSPTWFYFCPSTGAAFGRPARTSNKKK